MIQSKVYSQLIIANFTVHSPLNLLSVCVCIHRALDMPGWTADWWKGRTDTAVNCACMHLQPMYAVSE